MSSIAERLRGTGHPQERVMASAQYLAEHLAEVPAIVIPTIIGRHDGNGRPGLFDSVIQAAWSFCLALRARGLGTTWVTAALEDEARVKEILGIPDHMTEIVLLPVAWTKGTEFGRAPRHPARAITYFDRFGTTSERGPGDEPAVRGRARGDRRDRHRRSAGRRVVADQRHRAWPPASRPSPRAPSGRATNVGWAHGSSDATATTPSATGTCRARSTSTTNRTSFGWRTVRSRQPRCPMALRPRTGRPVACGCGSASPWARAVGHDGGDQGEPRQGSPRPAPPPRRGASQHATHRRGHQGAGRSAST